MDTVLGMALIMLMGFAGGQAARRLGLPSLTGYVVAGLVAGPHTLALIPADVVDTLRDPLSLLGVSVIAFLLGGDLSIRTVRTIGGKVAGIAVVDSLWTYGLVAAALLFLAGLPVYAALPLAALAASPAPTVIVPIVKELRARGRFTDVLLMTSALEDITCVILISLSVAVARPLLDASPLSFLVVGVGLLEILLSAAAGAALGGLLTGVLRRTTVDRTRQVATLTTILLGAGITTVLPLSALILILSAGFVVYNFAGDSQTLFCDVETVSQPVMLLFFTTAGATLQPGLIPMAGLALVIYVVTRIVAKFTGVRFATRFFRMETCAQENLHTCLLSQAGTTLGLTMLTVAQLPEVGDIILTVMLSAVLFFEILAPPLTRNALIRLGEAQCPEHTSGRSPRPCPEEE